MVRTSSLTDIRTTEFTNAHPATSAPTFAALLPWALQGPFSFRMHPTSIRNGRQHDARRKEKCAQKHRAQG